MDIVPLIAISLMSALSRVLFQTDKPEMIKAKLKQETEWGEKIYGGKTWTKDEWGKIDNGIVTLFHGTSPYDLPSVIKTGLKKSQSNEEDLYRGVWFSVTPYLAFFFNDVCLKVRVPISWVGDAGDGVVVERNIPPRMIVNHLHINDWH